MTRAACFVLALTLSTSPALAQLRGHGGPVRALAVSADGATAISASFDTAVIRWSLARNAAEQVLRFHDGAVNAVALLSDGRMVSAGEDKRIALWVAGADRPAQVLEGHEAPVVALAVSPDATTLASASWDHTVRLWSLKGSVEPIIVTVPTPLNSIVVAPNGEIAAGGADGKVYFLSDRGDIIGGIETGPTPIISIAISSDGALVAAAGIRGSVAIIERKTHTLARTLIGPGLPVWSLAFLPDNHTLLTGGADRMIRRWNAATGDPIGSVAFGDAADPLAAYAGDHGAEVFRACVACHTLSADDGNRAGPTLAGLFGRRIATLPGYRFSEALKKLEIVWTPETVSKLFEIGPMVYTPGTK